MGPYEVERTLGAGGMGTVLVARHRELDRRVALKVISLEAVGEKDVRGRFVQEARLMARLVHPNVVRLFDFGEDQGSLYIAMELLEGSSLRDRLDRGPELSPGQVREFCLAVAGGVAALHKAGIVHRDIKPENLFVTTAGTLKILDFGLARSPDVAALTCGGKVSGTPSCFPPEALSGRVNDPTYDVFQVGLVIHRLVTGEDAFPAPPFTYQLSGQPLPLPSIMGSTRGFGGLETVVLRCLEARPDDRYPSGEEVERALGAAGWPAGGPKPPAPLATEDQAVHRGQPIPTARRPRKASTSTLGRLVRRIRWHRELSIATVVGLALLLGLVLAPRGPLGPRATDPSVAPPDRASPGPATDWLDLAGTVELEDPLYSSGTLASETDPVTRLPSFARQLVEKEPPAHIIHRGLKVTLEYWPDPPVKGDRRGRIRVVALSRPGSPFGPTGDLPAAVQRLRVAVRAGDTYRFEVGDRVETIKVPPCRTLSKLRFSPGVGCVLFLHYTYGYPCRIDVYRDRDRRLLEPAPPLRKTPDCLHLARYNGLGEGEELTALLRPPGPSNRFVLARWPWRSVPAKLLVAGVENWLKDLESVDRRSPSLHAVFRDLGAPSGDNDRWMAELVGDGRSWLMPQVLVAARKLLNDPRPGMRRGAVSLIGLLDGTQLELIEEYLQRYDQPEDWIHGTEALIRSGGARACDLLAGRFRTMAIPKDSDWAECCAQYVPEEVLPWITKPAPDPSKYPEPFVRLLDQLAATMIGAGTDEYLMSIPRERIVTAGPCSIAYALARLETPESLARLGQLYGP